MCDRISSIKVALLAKVLTASDTLP